MEKSSMIKKSGDIQSSYPQDNVGKGLSGKVSVPDTMGCKMGGSDTNLAHSLKGASAVQK